MTRVLLIGASGMLGRAFATVLRPHDAPSESELDITRVGAIEHGLVINCAAWTDVDGAESNEDAATAVNGHAVGSLARACERAGAKLLHFSTDYVFDGRAETPYPIDHPRKPLNAYGRGKALGEELIEASGCDALVVRTSWLYAPWGKNFVRTMARLGAQREELDVVDDQRGRPTSAVHLATSSLALLDAGIRGLAHVTDGGECTWYEFARTVIEQVNPKCNVRPCSSDAFVRPAPRPSYSVLDLAVTESVLGPMPAWRDNVSAVVAALTPLRGSP